VSHLGFGRSKAGKIAYRGPRDHRTGERSAGGFEKIADRVASRMVILRHLYGWRVRSGSKLYRAGTFYAGVVKQTPLSESPGFARCLHALRR
jgi:hypothetical protein